MKIVGFFENGRGFFENSNFYKKSRFFTFENLSFTPILVWCQNWCQKMYSKTFHIRLTGPENMREARSAMLDNMKDVIYGKCGSFKKKSGFLIKGRGFLKSGGFLKKSGFLIKGRGFLKSGGFLKKSGFLIKGRGFLKSGGFLKMYSRIGLSHDTCVTSLPVAF